MSDIQWVQPIRRWVDVTKECESAAIDAARDRNCWYHNHARLELTTDRGEYRLRKILLEDQDRPPNKYKRWAFIVEKREPV